MELPAEFVRMMMETLGQGQGEALCRAIEETEPSVSIRINGEKVPWCRDGVAGYEQVPWCRDGLMGYEQVPWCRDGYYLKERPSFTFDPLLHAGAYYVQEASSMFLARVLEEHLPMGRPLAVLDLCAAPGGKSTLVRSRLPEGSLLVSNEPMRQRAQVLAENMVKWGHPDCIVTQNYPADFVGFTDTFDLIVADVPCSGEGMFRKDEGAIRDWSLENVEKCWRLQREIVETIWGCLKPGGLMVYSTCTFNRMEDEENVLWIAERLGAEVLPVAHEGEWQIAEGSPGYHFYPGRTRGEGLYMAVLRKAGGRDEQTDEVCMSSAIEDGSVRDNSLYGQGREGRVDRKDREDREDRKNKRKKGARGCQETEQRMPQIELPEGYVLKKEGEKCIAAAQRWESLILRLKRMLHCLVSGVEVMEQKGKDWMPCHALALSSLYPEGMYPELELTYEQAIAYLRREALHVEAPRGYVVVSYRGLRLGFVKSVGNRVNNMYPQEWRIRTTYTPEEQRVLN